MEVSGYVDNIVYRNEENGYTVLVLKNGEKEMTLVGTFNYINPGEYIVADGEEVFHDIYGQQIKVSKYEIKVSRDELSIRKYLGSGAIKGIGEKMAKRIVDTFGGETFDIIESQPERLAEIKGITLKKARTIYDQVTEQRNMRDAFIYLQQFGISINLSVKIYKKYGDRLFAVLKENPYKLAEDIEGVGFKTSDKIAEISGIAIDSKFRILSGIRYTLYEASAFGHTCIPKDELYLEAKSLLGVDFDIDECINDLLMDNKIKAVVINEVEYIYDYAFFNIEMSVATRLKKIADTASDFSINSDMLLEVVEGELKLEFEDQQRMAIIEALKEGLLVITGGPGTGKTTIINGIINMFMMEGKNVKLCAPTGRAAKRMMESTGKEATTIHRLLEIYAGADEFEGLAGRDESEPVEADVIIVDEMSMVDIRLMNMLLKAVPNGCHLILVGDKDQLPSVGPGNVLRDIIDSKVFKTVELKKIFRQSEESDIVVNAHKINEGTSINLDNNSKDFFYLGRDNVKSILSTIYSLITSRLPGFVNCDMSDIQVLTPMRKGPLGVESLNKFLQENLNPKDINKYEKEYGDKLFREGDKVMQVKNNYKLEWEIRNDRGTLIDSGSGVFNGDTGVVQGINEAADLLSVKFDDGRVVYYEFSSLGELELAYAVTIHKSQGSEYPAVILPLLTGPWQLFNRNLLYTAVTRAKKCVCIVGSENTFNKMINNVSTRKRYSGLKEKIETIAMLG